MPIELTDGLRQQIQEDGLELDNRGFLSSDYIVRSDEAAFQIFQNPDIQLNESYPMTEQEMLDCILMISLRALEVEIDFETFCNLRIRAPSHFNDYDYDPWYERDDYAHDEYTFFEAHWDSARLMHLIMIQQQENIMRITQEWRRHEQQENIMRGSPDVGAPPGEESMIPDDNRVEEEDGESPPPLPLGLLGYLGYIAENKVRVALEHEEDTCYVCLENFANITFDGCMKTDVCCYLCAYKIMYTTKKCPHCRTLFSSFFEKPLDPTDTAFKMRRVRKY
jgi:hypothetical protein